MRLVNSFSYRLDTSLESINRLPSSTVPDMSLSLRDLLDRHARGGKVKTFEPVYADETSSIPVGLENLDKFDRWSLSKQLGDFIEVERGKLITARQHREQQAYKAAVDAAVAKRLSEQAEGSAEPVKTGSSKRAAGTPLID